MYIKFVLLWIFSFIFTAFIAVYQRVTGPTYPVSGKVELAGQTIKYKLIRSYGGNDDATVKFKDIPGNIGGELKYRRFGTDDDWTTVMMTREGQNIVAKLPHQPPAGKLIYQVTLKSPDETLVVNPESTVIRFKGDVPAWVLIPHILFIFTAMMMSTRTGLEAWARGKNTYRFAWITLITLFIGGLILGPVVQKYSFGAFWTGWPFGQDLTDNKTLVAFIFWAIAAWRLKKNPENRTWPIVAMFVLLLVFLIPHSMFGSSLNYGSGQIQTGK
jgi:hypothetical protein